MTNPDATHVGLLAITMQRFYNRVMAWMAAQSKAGMVGVTASQCPDWDAFMAAKAAFTQEVETAAGRFVPVITELPAREMKH